MQAIIETQARIVPSKNRLVGLAQRVICRLGKVSPEVTDELLNVLAKTPITKSAIELNTETVKSFTEESLLSGQPYSVAGITIQCLGERNKFSVQISPNVNLANAITAMNQLYIEQYHGGITHVDDRKPLWKIWGGGDIVKPDAKYSLAIPKSFVARLEQNFTSQKYDLLVRNAVNTSGHTIIFSEKFLNMESHSQGIIFQIMGVKEANCLAVGLLLGITSLAKEATGKSFSISKHSYMYMYTGGMEVNTSIEGYLYSFPEHSDPRTTIISPVK